MFHAKQNFENERFMELYNRRWKNSWAPIFKVIPDFITKEESEAMVREMVFIETNYIDNLGVEEQYFGKNSKQGKLPLTMATVGRRAAETCSEIKGFQPFNRAIVRDYAGSRLTMKRPVNSHGLIAKIFFGNVEPVFYWFKELTPMWATPLSMIIIPAEIEGIGGPFHKYSPEKGTFSLSLTHCFL